MKNAWQLPSISQYDNLIVITNEIEMCWRTYNASMAIFLSLSSWCLFSITRDTFFIYFTKIQIIEKNNEQKYEHYT
jgi:hypothetical protein